MANVILKSAESDVKDARKHYCALTGFRRPFWGHFFGAPESIYLWMNKVQPFQRTFNRLNLTFYMRKLFDFGLPRQLIGFVIDSISGMRVKLYVGERWRLTF